MASEMRAIDIDMSFAPVVDLARGNRAIGERAFSRRSRDGLRARTGVSARHASRRHGRDDQAFSGTRHRSLEDTHFDAAIDPRTLDELRETDLVPFADGIAAGAEAVMMAHVTYPAVDARPGRLLAHLDRGHPARRARFSRASCSATTSAWPRPNRSAASARASTRTCSPAAISCWCAAPASCPKRSRRADMRSRAPPRESRDACRAPSRRPGNRSLDNPQRDAFVARVTRSMPPRKESPEMETNQPRLADALARAERVHDRDVLDARDPARRRRDRPRSSRRTRDLPDRHARRAGLRAASSRWRLRPTLEFDYVHATRYRGATRRRRPCLDQASRMRAARARPCCWSTTSSTKATR